MFVTALLNTITIKRYVPILLCCLSLAACGAGGGVGPAPVAGSAPATSVATGNIAGLPVSGGGLITGVPISNSAPTASSVTITDSNGRSVVVGDALVGSYIYSDTDGDVQGVSTFRWLRNGVPITGAVATNYTVVVADMGTTITFDVTPVAATGVTTGVTVPSTSGLIVGLSPISAVVTASRTMCTTPCGIMFDSTKTISTTATNPFYELRYTWDYGDVGATFQQRSGINANKSSSPLGAHVYDQAGTYIATLTVSDSAGSPPAVKQVTITVKDPNVTYAAQTYCVSNTNNFTACPTQNPSFHLNSISAATTFLGNLRYTTQPTRVLFRSGETFITLKQIFISNIKVPVLISSYDVGAKPVFKVSTTFTSTNIFFIMDTDGTTITNLNFSGNYNPVTGMGNHPTAIMSYIGVTNSLVYQNQFAGMSINVYVLGNASPPTSITSKYQMVVDNYMTDWVGYSIYGSFGSTGVILGNTIKQNINAKSGSEGRCNTCLPNFPDEGPVRVPVSDHMLIQYNDMFNNAGWSTAGLAHQPNIRLGTSGTISKSVVADNLLKGGFGVLEMKPQSNFNPKDAAIRGDVIIERNKFTATSNTMTMIDSGFGDVTIRNNLFLKPNNGAPTIGTGTFDTVMRFTVVNTTPGNLTYVNRIYNNTFISLAQTSSPNAKLVRVNDHFTLFDIYNNLVYAPFAVGGGDTGLLSWKYGASMNNVHADNNLVFSPNNTNFVWNNGIPEPLSTWQTTGNGVNSLTSDPLLTNPSVFDATLKANSPAIDAGRSINGLMSDFNDKLRTSIPDIGALEF